MQKRKLGNLEVSAIGLGCMSMSFGYGPAGAQLPIGDGKWELAEDGARAILKSERGKQVV
jgi:aryl-alcohol dehydrogenase-like predicted oxidoreductase